VQQLILAESHSEEWGLGYQLDVLIVMLLTEVQQYKT